MNDKGDKKIALKIPVEKYSRVVGYYRPVKAWNKGKKEEFRMRKTFDVSDYIKKESNEGQEPPKFFLKIEKEKTNAKI